jgi:hypothetical protein
MLWKNVFYNSNCMYNLGQIWGKICEDLSAPCYLDTSQTSH